MNLFERIAEFIRKKEFYLLEDFQLEEYEIRFKELDDFILLDIGNYIKKNLQESKKIDDVKNKLFKEQATQCNSLDELLPLIKETIQQDYIETLSESVEYNWNFQYYPSKHFLNDKTICIFNSLTSVNENTGNSNYPLLSVRKHSNCYYFWFHN